MKDAFRRRHVHKTVQLGELVVAAFNKAARFSANPEEVSRLATSAVIHMLRRAGRTLAVQAAVPVAVHVED